MATYTVFRNPTNGNIEAVKRGFSFSACLLNLVGLGWVWAFANHAFAFGWRLLVLTVVVIALSLSGWIYVGAVAQLLWIVFSGSVGSMANNQISPGLRRRGFTVLRDSVIASTADAAIEDALATVRQSQQTAEKAAVPEPTEAVRGLRAEADDAIDHTRATQ